MITLLLALIAATAAAPPLLRTFGRPAFGVLALVPGLGFGWLVYQFANGTFKAVSYTHLDAADDTSEV